jgi:membrane protease YdiL (CAAX protease family)
VNDRTQLDRPQIFPTPTSGTVGVGLAIAGFAVGAILSAILVQLVVVLTHDRLVHHLPVETSPVTVANLVGLWVGLVGAAVVASRLVGSRHTASDLGLRLCAWPDVPVGIAVGLGSQLLLIPLLYLPFVASHPHLSKTLSREGVTLTSHLGTAGFVIVALLVVVGAPVVEELFFRGLVLGSLEAWFGKLGRRIGVALAIVVMGVAFGFAHSEGLLVAYGLAVFGMVLGILAKCFGRLGPGIVAHASFNAASVVALALIR